MVEDSSETKVPHYFLHGVYIWSNVVLPMVSDIIHMPMILTMINVVYKVNNITKFPTISINEGPPNG